MEMLLVFVNESYEINMMSLLCHVCLVCELCYLYFVLGTPRSVFRLIHVSFTQELQKLQQTLFNNLFLSKLE